MSNAERQKKWRKDHKGYARLREKNYKRRVRAEAKQADVRNVPNKRPFVRNGKVPVRDVQETHYETDDEAWEREHGPRVVVPDRMEPAKKEVMEDKGKPTDQTPEEQRVALWLKSRSGGRNHPRRSRLRCYDRLPVLALSA